MPSEIQASELLRYISEGFVFVDSDFRIGEMNAEAVRLDGRPASEFLGKTLWEAWPQYDRTSPLGALWLKVMRDRVPALLEQISIRAYRDPIWLEVRAFPSGDGMAVYYRDITDRKRSEEELKRAEAELIHASRVSAMGTMALTLAHELSQPLTAVSNYVDSCARILRPIAQPEVRAAARALGLAGASARRASEILRRLRAFVSKREVQAEIHDLQEVIADACVLLLPHARRQGVEIGFALDRSVKWVRVDAVQIQQVLINLVNNSMEAMETSGEKLITISSRRLGDGAIEVAVADTGPGLAANAEMLFSPFVSGKSDGMGVGLSISRTIIEAHGGSIGADPPGESGATFRFTLPRGEERSANAA
jgi:two-component system sensor kinase FixL